MSAIAEKNFIFPTSEGVYFHDDTESKKITRLFVFYSNIPETEIEERLDFIKRHSRAFMEDTLGYTLIPGVSIILNEEGRSEEELEAWKSLFDDIKFQLDLMERKDLFEKFKEYKLKNKELASRLSEATRNFLFGLFLTAEESKKLKGKLTQYHYDILETLLLEVEALFDSIMLPGTNFHNQLLEKAKQAYTENT